MDDFLKMDIFFAVATVALVVVGGAFVLVLVRVFSILGTAKRIIELVEAEAKLFRVDVAEARRVVRQKALSLKTVVHQILQVIFRQRKG